MKRITILAAASAAALFCAGSAFAQGHSGGHAAAHATAPTQTTNANANGAANAAHVRDTPAGMNGPAQTGQPGAECGSATAPNTPGNAANSPGSPFNPSGNAGTHYAGEQPQNSRNTASVSQYDSVCAHQPH